MSVVFQPQQKGDPFPPESRSGGVQGYGTVATPSNTNPRDCGGPENSFNLWDEGCNPNAVLADYGNAYSFMLFLHDCGRR